MEIFYCCLLLRHLLDTFIGQILRLDHSRRLIEVYLGMGISCDFIILIH